MKQEINEVFDIRNYLVENDYPKGLIAMLDDYFTNKTISREEIEEMMEQENFAELVGNYQLRGAKKMINELNLTPSLTVIFFVISAVVLLVMILSEL